LLRGSGSCTFPSMDSQARGGRSLLLGTALALATLGYAACGGKGVDSTSVSAGADAGASGAAASRAGASGVSAGAVGLGGAGNAAGAGAGTAGVVTCDPTPIGAWTPVWTPPATPTPGVCTAQQISTEVGLCGSGASLDRAACAAFDRDPANTACVGCLFTTTDQSKYGAVTIDANNYWQTNIPGCIAEIDGDLSANGCGAKDQAYSDCLRTACEAACWADKSSAAYSDCRAKASAGDCQAEQAADVCAKSPKYASCVDYSLFADYFVAIGGLFCSTGFGAPVESGAAGATQ
jgi:hypothetical protein